MRHAWPLAALFSSMLAGCGPAGSKVTVLHVEDEVVDRAPTTVAGSTEVRYTSADGVTLVGSYWAPRDPATKACVLFSHQLGSTRREYDPVIARLVGEAHLYAVDLRGHGASTAGPHGELHFADFEYEDWAKVEDDLLAALDVLRAHGAGDACVVVGASIGSSAALRMDGAHPERVRGLVLLSPGLSYHDLATPDAARAVRSPVLIVHSQEKGAYDAATALAQIFAADPVEVEVIASKTTSHGMTIVAGEPDILDRVVGFVSAHL